MIKITEAAALAMHAAAYLQMRPGRDITTREIAGELKASAAHLAKVLQRLEKAGLLRGTRGPHGGYALNAAAGKISLLNIYEAVEGPMVGHVCLLGKPACIRRCPLGGLLKNLSQSAREKLGQIRLMEFAQLWGKAAPGGAYAKLA